MSFVVAEEFLFDDMKCIESLVGPYPLGLTIDIFYRPEGAERDKRLIGIGNVKRRLSTVNKDKLTTILRELRIHIDIVGNANYVHVSYFNSLHELFRS